MGGMKSTSTFEALASDVYRWAFRVLGHHQDSLDVVQEVFLKWHRQCSRIVPDQPRGWLRRVTVNRAIDLRRQRRTVESPDAILAESADASPDLMAREDCDLLRADFAEALESLSDAQRSVLVAKVYDELTFRQIAQDLGLAMSTVKTHYLRALRAVRQKLKPRWSQEDSI